MPVDEGAYLPKDESSFRAWWFRMYLRLAYAMWRRALEEFLGERPARGMVRVLDCGCGPGFLLRFFEEWFAGLNLVGMDMDRLSLRYAQNQTRRASLVRGSVSGSVLPIASQSCDVVVALHVVEHLEEPDAFILEARRVLRPGGLLMLATPNPAGLGAKVMGAKWKGIRDDHIALRPPSEWRAALESAGFRVHRDGTTGVSGIPIFQRMPLAILHWLPLVVWGYFPWKKGEAYVCLAKAA